MCANGSCVNRLAALSALFDAQSHTGHGSFCCCAGPNRTRDVCLQVRSMPLFTEQDHPNTLAAVGADANHLWVLLHNLGDVSGQQTVGRVKHTALRSTASTAQAEYCAAR